MAIDWLRTGRVECHSQLHTGTQTLATFFNLDGASAIKSSMMAQTQNLQTTCIFPHGYYCYEMKEIVLSFGDMAQKSYITNTAFGTDIVMSMTDIYHC